MANHGIPGPGSPRPEDRRALDRPTLWTGVEGVILSPELASALNSPDGGLLLQRVEQGSPAAGIGLRGGAIPVQLGGEPLLLGGDIVLAFAGVRMDGTPESLRRARSVLSEMAPGAPVEITVLRDGRRRDLTLTVR